MDTRRHPTQGASRFALEDLTTVDDPKVPAPTGFLNGNGFPVAIRPPGYQTRAPAEIVPHQGLIPIILSQNARGFPLEEDVHATTISRHPRLLPWTLREYWHGQTGDDMRSIAAWRPFVEAINQVYLDLHGNFKQHNRAYGAWAGPLLLERLQSTGEESAGDARLDLAPKIHDLISGYKAHQLHRTDLHQDWLRNEGLNRILLILIEIFLPRQVTYTMPSDGYKAPEEWWQAISHQIESWQAQVDAGQSPFPIDQATPATLFPVFAKDWAHVTAATMALLFDAILSPTSTAYLVRSLPALHAAFNPLAAARWISRPSNDTAFPYLLMLRDPPQFAVIGTTEHAIRDSHLLHTIWREFADCSLYPNPRTWRLTESQIAPLTRQHFTKMALHIWRFLSRLEQVWRATRAKNIHIQCPHCRMLRDLIAKKPSIARALQLRLFTKIGLRPLLAAARQYSTWLARQVEATYHRHPLFDFDSTVTAEYRESPFFRTFPARSLNSTVTS